jgi:competence protein ComEC
MNKKYFPFNIDQFYDMKNSKKKISFIENFRLYLFCRIHDKTVLKGYKDEGGVIESLIIGEKSFISYKVFSYFRNSGTAHLIAISGLHITLIVSGFFKIISSINLIKRNGSFDFVIRMINILFSLFFLFVSGNSISSQRAVCMNFVNGFYKVYFGKNKLWTLVISAFIILFINPFAIFSIGFILFFSAVLSLIIAPKGIMIKNFFLNLIMMPFIFFYFKEYNLLSPIINLIIIPVFSFIIVPIVIFSVLFNFFFPSIYAIKFLLYFLKTSSDYGYYIKYQPSLFTSLTMFVFFVILTYFLGLKEKKNIGIMKDVHVNHLNNLMKDNSINDTDDTNFFL